MTLTERTIDAQHATFERLAEQVRSLSDEDLLRPSGASEWTVAQVLSHLGSGSQIHLETLRCAADGKERPGDLNGPIWDRWNALSPREQADGFLEHGQALADELAGYDAATRSAMRVPLGYLPAPVGLDVFVGLRLNEDALHGWDVQVAFDDAELTVEVAEVLLDLHRGPIAFLLGFTGKPAALGRTAALTVLTPEPVGLQLAEQAAIVDAPAAPDGELRLPLPAFLRLLAGRLRELPDGALTGDVKPDELLAVFPGY